MNYNPFDPANFEEYAPCMPCCTVTTECSCALLIPPLASPYADYATAEAALDPANHIVADCLAYYEGDPSDLTSLTASFDGTTLTVAGSFGGTSGTFGPVWISASAKAGATITVSFTDATHFTGTLYDCNGTEIENFPTAAGGVTTSALPADGVYYFKMTPNIGPPIFPPPPPFSACTITVTSSDVWWVNPVIALWDDSGTTRQLEACPKFLMPPGTEVTGDWYSDCVAAHDYLSSSNVSNCIGNMSSNGSDIIIDTFTATDGGSSMTLDGTIQNTGTSATGVSTDGCINLNAGSTPSITWSASSPAGGYSSYDAFFFLIDYAGNLIDIKTDSGTGGALNFSAVPYSGKYYVHSDINGALTGFETTNAMTASSQYSDASLSVNPIQALYDTGLSCPARLDCGDSCP